MASDDESDIAATLQVGPTSEGMVRVHVRGEALDLPMDFEPEDAEEIADELRAAAERARGVGRRARKLPKGGPAPLGGGAPGPRR